MEKHITLTDNTVNDECNIITMQSIKEAFMKKAAHKKQEILAAERKRALEMKQDKELSDFKLLLKKAEHWQQLKIIRDYINEVEAKSVELNLLGNDIAEWVLWARNKTNWYDPQINADDELLNDVNKEIMKFNRAILE